MNLGYGNHFLRPQIGHIQILVKKYHPNQILLKVEQARPNTMYNVFSDGLNLFWFYLMFKILISTTPAIKPLMEKKKVEIKIRTQEFHEKMIMMKNKNLLKMNKMKDNMVEKVQDNIENVRDQVTNSMTGTGFLKFFQF